MSAKGFAHTERIAAALQRPSATFDSFLEQHPLYAAAFNRLTEVSRLLSISGEFVYQLHGQYLGTMADDILRFVRHAYGDDYVERYVERVNALSHLQAVFDANPSTKTLGSFDAVASEDYGLALLLSMIFTNHRFEIMAALTSFLDLQHSQVAAGKIASIGAGTGYELKCAVERLPSWAIEAYEIDPNMVVQARRLLQFFGILGQINFANEFPLDEATAATSKKYDALILCEVLEHLPDPARALRTLRECLRQNGRMFITMAINIAQEDHIFWYPDIETCRAQIKESGLLVLREWISPQCIVAPSEDREQGFRKGNYIAIVGKNIRS